MLAWNKAIDNQKDYSLKILQSALSQNNQNILLKQTYKDFKIEIIILLLLTQN